MPIGLGVYIVFASRHSIGKINLIKYKDKWLGWDNLNKGGLITLNYCFKCGHKLEEGAYWPCCFCDYYRGHLLCNDPVEWWHPDTTEKG